MKHPTNRAERRFARTLIINHRKFIINHIWTRLDSDQESFIRDIKNPLISFEYLLERLADEPKLSTFTDWLDKENYVKWNLTCDCWRCTYYKRNSYRRKRRVALKTAGKDWELDCESPAEYW